MNDRAGDNVESCSANGTSPERLMSEGLSLAIVLGATLSLSALERRGLLPGSGLISSLTLLLLSYLHLRRFDLPLGFCSRSIRRKWFPLYFSLGLLVPLLISLGTPLEPGETTAGEFPQWLHMLIIVPLSEEFYFRGLLLDHLRRAFTRTHAVLLCTLLFSLLHLPVNGMIVAAMLSLATCMLVLKFDAWIYAFQLHVAWNGLVGGQHATSVTERRMWVMGGVVVIVATTVLCRFARRASQS